MSRAFTVALVGPDGAGKTTICRKLVAQLPWKSKYVYMGINQDACNVLLPTTWAWLRLKKLLGRHSPMGGPPVLRPVATCRRFHPLRSLKSLLRTANLLAEEWYRQLICWFAVQSGKIVVMDRHFLFDYYAHDIAPAASSRTLASRIHGYILKRFPIPDLIILLDMPAELLYQRKSEGTVEALARRRQEYLALRHKFPHVLVIDADQPLDVVVCRALDAITAVRANLKDGASSSLPWERQIPLDSESHWDSETPWEGEAPLAGRVPWEAEAAAEPSPPEAGLESHQVRWSFYAHTQLNDRTGNPVIQRPSLPGI